MSQNKIRLPIIIAKQQCNQQMVIQLSAANYQQQFNSFIKQHNIGQKQAIYLEHRIIHELDRLVLIAKQLQKAQQKRLRHQRSIKLKKQKQQNNSLTLNNDNNYHINQYKVQQSSSQTQIRQMSEYQCNQYQRQHIIQNQRKKQVELVLSDSQDQKPIQKQYTINKNNQQSSRRSVLSFGFQTQRKYSNNVDYSTQTPIQQHNNNQPQQQFLTFSQQNADNKNQQNNKPLKRNLRQQYETNLRQQYQTNLRQQYQTNYRKKSIKMPQKHNPPYFEMINSPRQEEQPRKLIFLQNYQPTHKKMTYPKTNNNKQIDYHSSNMKKQKQVKQKLTQQQTNKISQRLYTHKTQSFQSKKCSDRNPQQQQDLDQIYNYQLEKAVNWPNLDYFQDMSNKTTASFRQKQQPELYQQNQQYIKQCTFQPKISQKPSKIKQQFKYNGRKCQAKQIAQKKIIQEKQRKFKQQKIRQRIKKGSISPQHYSISPASKSPYRSRKCVCCDKSQKKCTFKPSISPYKKTNNNNNKTNKKYVSSLLSQAYNDFKNQLRQPNYM